MKVLNTFALKMIAVIAMLVDHVGMMFFPDMIAFRIVGRVAFPIFAYTLVEGFFYTKNKMHYLIRLGIFAFVSEIPFDLAGSGKLFDWEYQNVYFTLFLGLVMLMGITNTSQKWMQYLIAILTMIVSRVLHTDYDALGIITIWIFYWFRNNHVAKMICFGIVMACSNLVQTVAVLAIVPLSLHNGKQGPKWKYFFYLFYPVHFIVLYVLKLIL